jgi:ATP-dependent DNA ligase
MALPGSAGARSIEISSSRPSSRHAVPYEKRRNQLESLELPPPVSVSPRFDDGEALFAQTQAQDYEGVVAKRRRSFYGRAYAPLG